MIIYKATNLINGKVYIGKTIQTFKQRIYDHRRNAFNNGRKYYFYNALRKYGWDNFKWEILENCKSENILISTEKKYINYYKQKGISLYNVTDGGEGTSGYKQSIETLQKLSKIRKGKVPWNKGIPQTKETKKKISIANIGRKSWSKGLTKEIHPSLLKISKAQKGNKYWLGKKHTEESKKKIGKTHKGKIISKETKHKMSEAKKGIISWNRGKHHTEETKHKISESNKGKTAWNKGKPGPKGKENPFYGKKHTKEIKRKISEAQKRAWAKRKGLIT